MLAAASFALGLLACEAIVSQRSNQLRAQNVSATPEIGTHLLSAPEFKQTLRVCNAYTDKTPISVYLDEHTDLTQDGPMAYQTCKDFKHPFAVGDRLVFRVGNDSAGDFAISDLPKEDAIMLLVIYRHDALNTAASFESHVFANMQEPQVAVIDTFKSDSPEALQAMPRILDPSDLGSPAEALPFGGVVAVKPGRYEIQLSDLGTTRAATNFVASARESYVIMRTGVESKTGPSFPEDLVIFPKSGDSYFSVLRRLWR